MSESIPWLITGSKCIEWRSENKNGILTTLSGVLQAEELLSSTRQPGNFREKLTGANNPTSNQSIPWITRRYYGGP
ncbi:MAG: hypothetical protein ABJQ38_06440, partial [Flavobacteriaceae bacterium]